MNAVRTQTSTAGTEENSTGADASSATGRADAETAATGTREGAGAGEGTGTCAGAAVEANTLTHAGALSHDARNLQWLLAGFIEEVPGVRSVAVVSSDGLPLLSSQPDPMPGGGPAAPSRAGDVRMDLAAVVSGLASLTMGAAKLMDGGKVRQTTVAMDDGMLFVMSISDGSLLGVHAAATCDLSVVAYHMELFVGRAGHVLTPALRGELRKALDGGR